MGQCVLPPFRVTRWTSRQEAPQLPRPSLQPGAPWVLRMPPGAGGAQLDAPPLPAAVKPAHKGPPACPPSSLRPRLPPVKVGRLPWSLGEDKGRPGMKQSINTSRGWHYLSSNQGTVVRGAYPHSLFHFVFLSVSTSVTDSPFPHYFLSSNPFLSLTLCLSI